MTTERDRELNEWLDPSPLPKPEGIPQRWTDIDTSVVYDVHGEPVERDGIPINENLLAVAEAWAEFNETGDDSALVALGIL